MTDPDEQSRALATVLSEEPRYGMYAISAPRANGSRVVRGYCARCRRQDAVIIVSRTGRVTRKPGDGSLWNPEEEM